ncbi:glycosyltransferase [Clostridium tertium]|uniref:PssE/Cps14G family polysaccharide biosynthesis glycosyltransferase n=1 Tax=Clostridium tertium TaxID=1559 RepID=UPI00232F8D0A|nr:PssE/Cps14G family polysaccharide biosynthesis glycosyltransferase [Clostridium tertium]MDB1944571.1 glycosyltransferase [Clostridium tertium]MDB1951838.1 glycosyltransferase [Clostridium tertium]
MIFVTLGSQKFQFNRLLKEIDRLVFEKKVTEEIFAQIGYSDYIPRNYKYKKFLDRDEFKNIMSNADKVITHGGTGAIIGAIKQEKKVIAVPRLQKYGEHVDDHQIEIVNQFEKMNLISRADDISAIDEVLRDISEKKYVQYISNTENIIDSIDDFINS